VRSGKRRPKRRETAGFLTDPFMNGMLLPGSWLGLMGGGQLGRMFAMAAQTLGYRVLVLDPDDQNPARAVSDDQLLAEYDDEAALDILAMRCLAITTEFENVPAESLSRLANTRPVSPSAESVAIAQDRIAEKRFIESAGIAVAPHCVVEEVGDLDGVPAGLYPAVLKASRFGYDGKGQVRVADRAAAERAFLELGEVPCVLERQLELEFEVSVVLARDLHGNVTIYPVAENIHRDGILLITRVPSPRVTPALGDLVRASARAIAEALNYHGVLCVEFFVLADHQLLVNEIAPRPHNSGHFSIDACVSSQFEAQARILAQAPLGSSHQHSAAVMLNLLGDIWFRDDDEAVEPDWAMLLANPHAKLHLYGKRSARRGRKMGHVTLVGQDPSALWDEARTVADSLSIEWPSHSQ
jgi:5-(carboxyamino)imidazole ribonucleotide synthase